MRAISGLALGLSAMALLTACNKKSEAPVMPSSAPLAISPEASSSAPAALTPDQQKMLAALPAPFNAADPVNGMSKFALCRSCHTIVKGGPNLTGPNLYGVYGSKSAAVPGFEFSDAMKAANKTWDAPTIDKWIENPRAVLPETKMTFAGVTDAKNRADIIAYVALQRDK